MRLAKKFAFGVFFLVVGLTASVMIVVNTSLTQALTAKLKRDLTAAQRVFREFQELRSRQLHDRTRMAAEMPQLKAVVTTPGLDHATLLDSARAAQALIRSELLMLADQQGHLLASATEPTRVGDDLTASPAFQAALRGEPYDGVWETAEALYQVSTEPVVFGEEISGAVLAGVVLAGFEVTPALIEVLEQMTNCSVVVAGRGRLVTSPAGRELFRHLTPDKLAMTNHPEAAIAQTIGGYRYLTVSGSWDEGRGSYLLARSLDEELAFYRKLQGQLVGLAGFILLVALLFGVVYARQLTQPLRALVAGTQRIAAGDWSATVTVKVQDELGELAKAFNNMAKRLTQLLNRERELAAAAATAATDQQRAKDLADLNAQLAAKMKELEQFHQFLMGREDRILELKQEVNALLKVLGQDQKYTEGSSTAGLSST